MNVIYRLKIITAITLVAAIITGAWLWALDSKDNKGIPKLSKVDTIFESKIQNDVNAGKFTNLSVVSYQGPDQSRYVAWQVQPKLDPVPARPRDVAILVDTSASQSGRPFQLAKSITREFVREAAQTAPGDRVNIWTVNIPQASQSLTKGFVNVQDKSLSKSLDALDEEYPSGAVDLKTTLEKVAQEFSGKNSRQQVILYLGDGESAYHALTEKDRYTLSDKLLGSKISFFAVPLGLNIHSKNIHSLVSSTGGAVVRFFGDEVRKDSELSVQPFIARINKTMSVPVLLPTDFKFQIEVEGFFPTKLPPLRADSPTLVLARLKDSFPKEITATLTGKILDKEVKLNLSEKVPASSADHFFLANMFRQWQKSPYPDAPALLRSDRTLALSFEQSRIATEELRIQGEWALNSGRNDIAKEMFMAVKQIDPMDREAVAGLNLLDKINRGELSREQLNAIQGIEKTIKNGSKTALQDIDKKNEVPKTAPPKGGSNLPPKGNSGAGTGNLLAQEQARRAVIEQQMNLMVEETLRRARSLFANKDPDGAKQIIMQQRDSVAANPDLSDKVRKILDVKMEALLSEIGKRAADIKQQLANERESVARAKEKLLKIEEKSAREEQIRDRIRAFSTLMNQARFEDAYREALVLQQESVNKGEPIPIEAQAAYQIGQAANNYREARELVRIREDRFLLTMMQVERSHIPYPDEPPVHFPPAKVWREMVNLRKKYATTDFQGDLPEAQERRMNNLRQALNRPIVLEKEISGSLKEIVDILEEVSTPPEAKKDSSLAVKILINSAKLQAAKGDATAKIEDEQVRLPKLTGASLSTALRLLTEQLNATYIVRRDFIEITSAEAALREKVIGVYPVEDLVVPIPNSVNQMALRQSVSILGQTFSLGGGFTGQPIAGAFGGFGGFGFGAAGFGAGIRGQAGIQGGQQNVGALFQGQNVNLGAGGGITGFGGGNLGQFGNLGGQFGFQGGNQSTILVSLIQQLIAPGEWLNAQSILGGQGLQNQGANGNGGDPADPAGGDANQPLLTRDMLNSLGYYPAARALVVRGTSRFHKQNNSRLNYKSGDNAAASLPIPPKKDKLAMGQGPKGNPGLNKNPGKNPDQLVKINPPAKNLDPKEIWNDAVAKEVTDPGLIIACSDALAKLHKFKHAAELLKASLRKGLTPEPWAQEALALALESSQGSQIELERAKVSGIDLDPQNASAYLRAAKGLAEIGQPERAIAFCKQASMLQPEIADPYLDSLKYAENLKKVDPNLTAWAAREVLDREWLQDTSEFHKLAKVHVQNLINKLQKSDRGQEVGKLQKVLSDSNQRDLVIQLLWSNSADLDLSVLEPNGSVCSYNQNRTTGGGTLDSDSLAQTDGDHREQYTAAQAFSGVYQVRVRRVWGKPLGNKASVKVIRNQGTPEESVELFSLDLSKKDSLTISVDKGRRVALAQLPPPAVGLTVNRKPDENQDVMRKLQAMTQPGFSGFDGGFGSATNSLTSSALNPNEVVPMIGLKYQTQVYPSISTGMQLQASIEVANGTKGSNMTVRPIYETFSKKSTEIKLDLIPGGES